MAKHIFSHIHLFTYFDKKKIPSSIFFMGDREKSSKCI